MNRRRSIMLLMAGLMLLPGTLLAQEEADAEPEKVETLQKPLVTVAVAGVEKLKTDMRKSFESVGRVDIYEAFENWLETIGNLDGLDQDKPVGVMVYLQSGFPPVPRPIGYIPVDSIEDLSKTIELGGNVVVSKIEDDRYELVGLRGEMQVKLQHGYAFLSDNAEVLDRNFSDPVRSTRQLTAKYDIGMTLNMDSIPALTKTLALGFLKTQAMTEMQRRDEEPLGEYKIRRAAAEQNLNGIVQTIEELERLTIGFDANPEGGNMTAEMILIAQENSDMAKEMKSISTKRDYFASIVQEDAPMTMSMSFPIQEKDRENMKEMIRGGEMLLQRELSSGEELEAMDPEVAGLAEAWRDTIDAGHLNMFMQFYGEPKEFVIVGGIRVTGGQKMAAGLKKLATIFQTELEGVGELTIDADNHRDVAFHHIASREPVRFGRPNDEEAPLIFGEKTGIYFGSGSRTAWMAIGGPNAMEKTKELMDTLASPPPANRERKRRAPFQLVFNMKKWLGLDRDGEGVAIDAFEESGDRLVIDMRPLDNGIRIRALADEGYLKLIASGAARGVDRGREWRERRRQRRAEGGGGDGERRRRGRPGGDGGQ